MNNDFIGKLHVTGKNLMNEFLRKTKKLKISLFFNIELIYIFI